MQNFINTLFETVKERFDGNVIMQEVNKNNGKLTGFTFRRTEEQIVAPTVYPSERDFDAYRHGEATLEQIADAMIKVAVQGMDEQPDFDIENIANWEFAKTRILPMVISKDTNEELLKDLAHTDSKTDLAIIYHVILGGNFEDGVGCVKVTNKMREQYGVSMTEMKKCAFANAKKQMYFKTVGEELAESMGNEAATMMGIDTSDNGMWMLSNTSKTNGAGAMFVPNVLKAVAKRVNKETFYILPSSIHEVLIVTLPVPRVESLKELVEDVNTTQVSPKDKLSDSVYFYNGKTVEKVA